jgi:hypothetical protein
MNIKFVGLGAALLLIFSVQAHSAGISGLDLQLGLGSVHAEKRSDGKPWNERNSGAAIQYISNGVLFGNEVEYCATAGQLSNSEYGQTIFTGGCFRKTVLRGQAGKISVGAFTGDDIPHIQHQQKNWRPVPSILPTASACLKWNCLDNIYSKVQENSESAILFILRFPIK